MQAQPHLEEQRTIEAVTQAGAAQAAQGEQERAALPHIYNHKIAQGPHQYSRHDFTSCDYPSRRGNIVHSYIADWAFVCLILACCAIYFADPPGKKYFRLDDPDLSYPDFDDVVFPSWLLHILYWLPPLIIISLAQIWIRSLPEWHATLLAFVETIAMTYMVTTFLMWSVGRLRPSWLNTCKPSVPAVAGPPYVFYTHEICTADWDDLRSAGQSFPSGHAATIFGSYMWLVFYLNAKLKVFDGNAHAWKLITFLPLLFATWISFSRVNDGKHFYFDVCSGIVLGIAIALIGYRLNFVSLFGPDNHIPCRLLWEPMNPKHFGVHSRNAARPVFVAPNTVSTRYGEDTQPKAYLNQPPAPTPGLPMV